ncbi:MAG: hypothetical protein ACI4DN_01920, partial [Lachnospiraceae bacterium]
APARIAPHWRRKKQLPVGAPTRIVPHWRRKKRLPVGIPTGLSSCKTLKQVVELKEMKKPLYKGKEIVYNNARIKRND